MSILNSKLLTCVFGHGVVHPWVGQKGVLIVTCLRRNSSVLAKLEFGDASPLAEPTADLRYFSCLITSGHLARVL